MTAPFDDETMVYDYQTHRYRLTEKYVLRELGIVLPEILTPYGVANPSTESERFLKRSSRTVYRYLLQDSWSPQFIEYILATDPMLRDRIREMLTAQLEYNMQNGFVDLQSGVNVTKGQTMDLWNMRGGVQVANEVEQLAFEILPKYGFCLKFTGRLPAIAPHAYHKGY